MEECGVAGYNHFIGITPMIFATLEMWEFIYRKWNRNFERVPSLAYEIISAGPRLERENRNDYSPPRFRWLLQYWKSGGARSQGVAQLADTSFEKKSGVERLEDRNVI